jgi:hypothetical protein
MIGETTEAVGAGVGGGSSGNKMPTLEEYGTNLTKLAEEVIFLTYWLLHYNQHKFCNRTHVVHICREN